ncbi:MAG: HAD-IC family P-type ATPase, partial [Clostridia bacterium]|nr:HAD-IC family P-type ATPase [Clostridia bacterium]
GRGAGLGILIKSADALDTLHKCSVAVMDKTGTITEGKMSVSDVYVADGYSSSEALSLSASLEKLSEHPIGRAIVEHAERLGLATHECTDFTQTFGGGVFASVDSHEICGGNLEFIKSRGVRVTPEVELILDKYASGGKTPVAFARDGEIMCVIAVADTIKPSSKTAVEMLRSSGFDVVMLTGDCEATARAIANEAGISHVISGVKPDEKASAIESIMTGEFFGDTKRRYAVMIGDGVNDAPALAMSDCGIAVAHGTDIAIESASVVLVKSDLCDAARAVRLSHAVMRNIGENLAWAFGYNILCIPIAAGVLFPAFGIALTPMISALAMSLSSVCVVSNALRLRAFKA